MTNDESGITKELRSWRLQDAEIREGADGVTFIDGYAAVFNERAQIWNFWEQIAPGAFTRTLATNPDVRATIEHEGGLTTIGRTRNQTLTLREDTRGLKVHIVPPDTQAGRDALTLVRDGYVDQMSFAFRIAPKGERWETADDGTQLRTLVDIELNDGDVSLVTYPAYPQTSAEARDRATAASQAAAASVDDEEQAERAKTQARAATRQREIEILRS